MHVGHAFHFPLTRHRLAAHKLVPRCSRHYSAVSHPKKLRQSCAGCTLATHGICSPLDIPRGGHTDSEYAKMYTKEERWLLARIKQATNTEGPLKLNGSLIDRKRHSRQHTATYLHLQLAAVVTWLRQTCQHAVPLELLIAPHIYNGHQGCPAVGLIAVLTSWYSDGRSKHDVLDRATAIVEQVVMLDRVDWSNKRQAIVVDDDCTPLPARTILVRSHA
jgi:hypothetical protein